LLVVFDCDGVLVDSEPISNGVLAQMLGEQGLPTSLPQARREYQGLLLAEVQAKAEARLGRALPEGWLGEYERRRALQFAAGLRAVEGAAELVGRCLSAGLSVCVASQGSLEKTAHSLTLTGLGHLFPPAARFSAGQVPRGKPHPDLFLLAARTMGIEASHAVVIEDTPSGVSAGARAGMRVIGYAGDADAAVLRAAGAGATIESLAEAWPLLCATGGLSEG
jgi:beta-phosphoglucomutase-like phosphatase (HAD superfamily)